MSDEDRKLLEEIADTFPWNDVNTYNVCGFCGATWEHRPDCIWVKVSRHLGRKVTDVKERLYQHKSAGGDDGVA